MVSQTRDIGQRRAPFIFITLTLVIDAMGIGLILPVLPSLIREITGGDLGNAAIWGGIMTTLFAVMQFVFGPTVGALSDWYGRRPVLLVSVAVVAVDFVIMGLAHAMWLLILTRIVGGIAAATQATAAAFIADISPPERKAVNFGIIGAAFGVGFVLGPLIGGLLSEFGHRAPFYAAAMLATLNFFFGFFVMPETLTAQKRRSFDWHKSNPLGAFLQARALSPIWRMLVVVFLYEFAFIVYPAVWAYYTPERFGWDERMVGISLASFGISMALVQGVLIRLIIPKLGERLTIIYGFCFNFVMFILLGVIENGVVALALTPISALGAVVIPALSGLMSRATADNQQGELQGLITSAKSLAMIFSPLAMAAVFFLFTRESGMYLPGAPFLLSAGLLIVGFLAFILPRKALE